MESGIGFSSPRPNSFFVHAVEVSAMMTKADTRIAEKRFIVNFLNFACDRCVKQLTYDILSCVLNDVASLLVLPSPALWIGVAPDCTKGEDLLGPAVSHRDGVEGIGADECLVFCEDLLFQVNFVAFFPEFVLSPLALWMQVTNEFLVQTYLVFFAFRNFRVLNLKTLPWFALHFTVTFIVTAVTTVTAVTAVQTFQ